MNATKSSRSKSPKLNRIPNQHVACLSPIPAPPSRTLKQHASLLCFSPTSSPPFLLLCSLPLPPIFSHFLSFLVIAYSNLALLFISHPPYHLPTPILLCLPLRYDCMMSLPLVNDLQRRQGEEEVTMDGAIGLWVGQEIEVERRRFSNYWQF